VNELTVETVAAAAGLPTATVARYVDALVLAPDASGHFAPADVARARLVSSLIEAGLPLERLAAAIADGMLSLEYVDSLMPNPVRMVPLPDDDDFLRFSRMFEPILGRPRLPGEPIREDDLAILRVAADAAALGAPEERVVQIIRAIARTAAHLVALQRDWVDELLLAPAVAETGSIVKALEVTARDRAMYRDLGRRSTFLLLDRFVDDAVLGNLVQLMEHALVEGGWSGDTGPPAAIVFIDVSEYSRRSEASGDRAAAEQALLLLDLVEDLTGRHGGRLVKSLGDGAMVHVPLVEEAVLLALDAVAEAPARGLWPLHVGVNAGPMVRLDADFYGSAVNVAARVAGQAPADEVLVTQTVVDLVGDQVPVEFDLVGSARLKNVSEPVTLYRARRHDNVAQTSAKERPRRLIGE
jgi:adenylate cyclase